MKGFKGFNEDMTSSGYQYKEGGVFEHEGPVRLCESGFHFCEVPHDVFAHNSPACSIYHEVEAEGVSMEKSFDSKRVASKLKVKARIDVSDICKMAVKSFFAWFGFEEKIKAATSTVARDYGAASAGDMGAANTGDKGAANAGSRGVANAGDFGAANAGDYGVARAGEHGAANAGKYGVASAGYYGAANAGDYGAANSGGTGVANAGKRGLARAENSSAANAGDYGMACAGRMGAASVGKYGIAVVSTDGKVKGDIGALLIFIERFGENEIISYAVEKVDGEKIKANTWYKLIYGKIVETE